MLACILFCSCCVQRLFEFISFLFDVFYVSTTGFNVESFAPQEHFSSCFCVLEAYIVARCICPDGVFCRQSDAAHCYDDQDGHLKVPQSHDVVAQPSNPEKDREKQELLSAGCSEFKASYLLMLILVL